MEDLYCYLITVQFIIEQVIIQEWWELIMHNRISIKNKQKQNNKRKTNTMAYM